MFDYSHSGLKPQDVPENLGFAGFRVNYHNDWPSDMAAFQGASYFRAVDGDLQYGMSQRGLAVDTGMPYPEEFRSSSPTIWSGRRGIPIRLRSTACWTHPVSLAPIAS